jgi:hypothetical protein
VPGLLGFFPKISTTDSQLTEHSWELGVLAEALTELECPHLAVFSRGSIPPPAHLKKGHAREVFAIAEKCVYLL